MGVSFRCIPRAGIAAAVLCLASLTSARAQEGLGTTRPTRFAIEQVGRQSWLVAPDGRRFFSRGVCCVNQGVSRTEFDPANPSYAAWQHYADSNQWAHATQQRLQSWGFTTIGGWSDFPAFSQSLAPDALLTPVLHIGASAGAPWWDMWHPRVVERMDAVAREQISPFRGDPRVIGYYSDNEIGWWNAILFNATLGQAPTSGQRQRLLELLRRTYKDNWSELLRDFEPAPELRGWDELENHGALFLRPGGRGIEVYRQFLGIVAERYYSLVHQLIRKYDAGALVLGDRYPSFYYPEVVRVAARYVDAISVNLNASWNDGRSTRFLLDSLHQLSGKPMWIGEFYLAAADNRSGNKNNHGSFPVVTTRRERALGFRNTLRHLANLPYVVGSDWFQYYDEPTHGRFDGENFNFGLVDIHDLPYEELVATAASLDLTALRRQSAPIAPDARRGVPAAPRDPLGRFGPGMALMGWDRERGFIPPASEFPLADLYLCWNRRSVFLGLYSHDVVEDVYYRGKTVAATDRPEWTVLVKGTDRPIRARIGVGREPVVDAPGIRIVNRSGLNGDVRNIAGMELPAHFFGRRQFRAGDTIELASTLLTHCRAYRMEWRGHFTLHSR